MAATDLEKLVVQLSANIKSYENAMIRANGVSVKQFRAIERRAAQFEKRFSEIGRNAGLGFARSLAGPLLGAASIQGGQSLIDNATRIENALKVAGLSGDELETTYDNLRKSALRNAAPLDSLVSLYSRLALVQKELNVSGREIEGLTDTISLALRVGGYSAQEASGALLQLSQALGSGVVRAEEFNSIVEGAPTILQAAAAGLKEANGSVAQLRTIMLDGKLSSEAFFRAIEAGTPYLEEKASGAVLTMGQRLTNLQTGLLDAARDFNTSAKAGETFGAVIDEIADEINNISFENLVGQFQQIATVIGTVTDALGLLRKDLRDFGDFTGLSNLGALLTGGTGYREFLGGAIKITSSKGIEKRINDAFEGQIENAGKLTEQAIRDSVLGEGGNVNLPQSGPIPAQRAGVRPVSLGDFSPPTSTNKGKGASAKKTEAERELEKINSVIEALRFEQEQLGRTAIQQEIYNKLKAAGVDITSTAGQEIASLVTETAHLEEAQKRAAEQQQAFNDGLEQMSADAIDAFGNVIAGTEEAADAFKKLAIEIVKSALTGKGAYSDFFSSLGGGSGGILGFLGGLFGGGGRVNLPASGPIPALRPFADGGYTGNGGKYQSAGTVHKGEYVFSKEATRRAGVANLEAMHRRLKGYSSGGAVGMNVPLRAPRMPDLRSTSSGASGGALKVNVGVSVDESGNLQAYVKSVSQETTAQGIKGWSKSSDFVGRTTSIVDQRRSNPRITPRLGG